MEDNKIWKSLHQECNCNEDFSCASVKQQRKSTSHYNSFEHYIGISNGRNANEDKHWLSTAAVMSNDAVISFPESVIIRLLQASGAITDSIFRNTLAAKSSDVIDNKLQQIIRTEPVNYVLVIFINHCVQLKSSEEHMMHHGIYSGMFSSSALIEDEVVFVPCIEVKLAVLFDFFRHLPKPFSCVIEDIGLHKIFCIRDQHHNSRFLGTELKNSYQAGRDLERPNSVFNGDNITILQVPGVFLPRCLELATASSSSSQKHIYTSSFIHRDKGMLVSPVDGLSKRQVPNTCVACKAVMTNNFKTSSDASCFTLGSPSGFVQDLSMCSKDECSGEPRCPECTVTCDTSKAFAESKQVSGEVMEENLDGRFTFEHHNELLLYDGDKGRCSVQWTDRQKLESDGGNICSCTSKSVLDPDWNEEAEQWHSDGASSRGATQENIAQRILVELRSLSHSLLDVFDIIQRTPPLTKRTFLLPRELLCQHKVLHASTSSLESCPLAQSECFRLNDDGASDTKKRRKKKKKTTN